MDKSSDSSKKTYETENLNESLKVIQLLEQLRLASIRGNLDGVKSAIGQGISVNQTLKGGWSPLLFACSMGHPDVVGYLLEKGAHPDFHKERFTALMAACASTRENEEKLVKCVDLLVKHKADVNATERHQISALMFAAKEGHEKIVAKLTSCDALTRCALDQQDGQGWTALFWAVNQGKVKVVEALLKAGASMDIKDRRGQTASDLAYSKGLDEILNIFQNKNKLTDTNACDEEILINSEGQVKHLQSDTCSDMELEVDLVSNADSGLGKIEGGRRFIRNAPIWHTRTKERFKRDKNCNCIMMLEENKPNADAIPWNTPYSLGDAVLLMKTTMKHLGVLYAGTSYIRLRLLGRRVPLPVENQLKNSNGLVSLTKKALHQTQILQDELLFLYQQVKMLEESNEIVPADHVVEKVDNTSYSRLTFILFLSITSFVLVYKNRSSLVKLFNF